MKFAWGPPPTNPGFHPEAEGWIPINLPPWKVIAMGSPIGIGLVVAIGYVVGLSGTPAVEIHLRCSGPPSEVFLQLAKFVSEFFFFFGALLFLHEFSHAGGFPRMGCSRDSVIGVWVSRCLCYATYRGSLSRNRVILVAALPLLLISVLPVMVGLTVKWLPTWVLLISIANAFGSGGDVLLILTLLVKVPRRAVLQDQGWESWWKPLPAD